MLPIFLLCTGVGSAGFFYGKAHSTEIIKNIDGNGFVKGVLDNLKEIPGNILGDFTSIFD